MNNQIDKIKDVTVYLLNFRQGKYLYVSPSIFDLLGYLPERFLDKGLEHLYALIHPADYPRILKEHAGFVNQITRKGNDSINIIHHKYRLQHDRQQWVWVENTGIILTYGADNKPENCIGFLKKLSYSPSEIRQKTWINFSNNLAKALHGAPPNGLAALTNKRSAFFSEISSDTSFPQLMEIMLDQKSDLNISRREKEVLQLIATGLSTKEIADQLFISNTTVISHRKNLLQKFTAKNTAELINKASKHFWLG